MVVNNTVLQQTAFTAPDLIGHGCSGISVHDRSKQFKP
jgi:hypothetical protein